MHRRMTVTGQVEVGLDEVLHALSSGYSEVLIRDALVRVFASSKLAIVVRASEPERVASRSACLAVAWRTVDERGIVVGGEAAVHVFAVQTGSHPVTELIVTLTVDDARARPIADGLHRLLEDVTARLAVDAPQLSTLA